LICREQSSLIFDRHRHKQKLSSFRNARPTGNPVAQRGAASLEIDD
jgi:hypothetical protein